MSRYSEMVKKRMKKKKNNAGGFTLIELLATISILSVVTSIVIVIALNVVNNAKQKSYEVTVNNIEKEASNYVYENNDTISWLKTDVTAPDGEGVEYQCVRVQELIDSGFFTIDILNSEIPSGKVSPDHVVYLERDAKTKTLIKNALIIDTNDQLNALCDVSYITVDGDINFQIEYFGKWTQEKDVNIYYTLKNIVGKYENYSYSYKVGESAEVEKGFENTKSKEVKLNGDNAIKTENTEINASLFGPSSVEGVNYYIAKETLVELIDQDKPTISVDNNSERNVWGTATINLVVNDGENPGEQSGVNVATFTKEDITVTIGGTEIDASKYTLTKTSGNDSEHVVKYSLTILNDVYEGEVVIRIGNEAVHDMTVDIANKSEPTELNTGVIFRNYNIEYISCKENVSNMPDSPDKKHHGVDYTISSNKPTVDYYTFMGWSDDSCEGEVKYNPSDKITENADKKLYAIWRANVVTIKHHVNADRNSVSILRGYDIDNDGFIHEPEDSGGDFIIREVEYAGVAQNLPDYNSSKYLNVTRVGYTTYDAQWKCMSDDCGNTTEGISSFVQNVDYTAEQYCEKVKDGDCEIVVGINWKPTVLTIYYSTNGGTITSQTTENGTVNNWNTTTQTVNGTQYADLITKNGELYKQEFNRESFNADYGNKGLVNYNNPNYINITRNGYNVKNTEEWICLNNECQGVIYNQANGTYNDLLQLCDISNSDCTIVLGVNWGSKIVKINYEGNLFAPLDMTRESYENGVEKAKLYYYPGERALVLNGTPYDNQVIGLNYVGDLAGDYKIKLRYISGSISDGTPKFITKFKNLENSTSFVTKELTLPTSGVVESIINDVNGLGFFEYTLDVPSTVKFNNYKFEIVVSYVGGSSVAESYFGSKYSEQDPFSNFKPTRVGYNFAGNWKLEGSVVGEQTIQNSEEHSLYAVWNAKKLTVSYDDNGNTASTFNYDTVEEYEYDNYETVNAQDQVNIKSNRSESGFVGWKFRISDKETGVSLWFGCTDMENYSVCSGQGNPTLSWYSKEVIDAGGSYYIRKDTSDFGINYANFIGFNAEAVAIWGNDGNSSNWVSGSMCTINVTPNDNKFNLSAIVSSDVESVAYKGWSSSYSGSNSVSTEVSSVGTYTYYVKDSVGNKYTCGIDIKKMEEKTVCSYYEDSNGCYFYTTPGTCICGKDVGFGAYLATAGLCGISASCKCPFGYYPTTNNCTSGCYDMVNGSCKVRGGGSTLKYVCPTGYGKLNGSYCYKKS